MNTVLLRTGALINLLLALFHLAFWKLFGWSEATAGLDGNTRAILYTLNLVVVYVLLAFAWGSIQRTTLLLAGHVGRAFLLGVAGFYIVRGIAEFLFFGMQLTNLAVFTLCLLIAALYVIPWYRSRE